MKNAVFYFSGTGNSFKVAQSLAKKLPEAAVYSIPKILNKTIPTDFATIGVVYPVYMYRIPKIVVRFLKTLAPQLKQSYNYLLATNGGEPGLSIKMGKKILKKKLSAGFSLEMPNNYIPFWEDQEEEKINEILSGFEKSFQTIITQIQNKATCLYQSPELFRNYIHPGILYKFGYNFIEQLGKQFWVNENCNSCKICVRLCPVENISMKDNLPVWKTQCEQCFACINWCPQKAIQYGQKTETKGRYHHPDIQLKDFIQD
ncbi:MAG: EFR1 family ferrodoxin [Spirochaetes bacterium]|nr:EFR1 family ferrodoxin [Spirochaetota bacterium]